MDVYNVRLLVIDLLDILQKLRSEKDVQRFFAQPFAVHHDQLLQFAGFF